MPLLAVGINHKTAPIELREKLHILPGAVSEPLLEITQHHHAREAVILSTCNRTEFYCDVVTDKPLMQWLTQRYQFPNYQLANHLYFYHDEAAVRHMMRVASGLDSLVLGEPQVLGQMKAAYNVAKQTGTSGKLLSRLFQQIFAVTKRIRTDTAIGVNPISIAHTAIQLAKRIFADLAKRSVLVIGAGETSELAARYLIAQGVTRLLLTSRSLEKATLLGKKIGATAFPMTELAHYLPTADIIISATSSPLPILGKGVVETALKIRKRQPILMLDIAVPRDIESEVGQLSDVYLYNIDDLQKIIQANLVERQLAAQQAEQIIDFQAAHFIRSLRSLEAVPIIRRYRNKIEQLRDIELNKALQNLQAGLPPEQTLHQLARSLTNKIMHAPTAQLRQAAYTGSLDVLQLADQLLELKD